MMIILLFQQRELIGTNPVVNAILIAVFAICIFLLLRGVLTWYWKINTIIKNQEENNRLLNEQNEIFKMTYGIKNFDSPEEIERKAKLYDSNS